MYASSGMELGGHDSWDRFLERDWLKKAFSSLVVSEEVDSTSLPGIGMVSEARSMCTA